EPRKIRAATPIASHGTRPTPSEPQMISAIMANHTPKHRNVRFVSKRWTKVSFIAGGIGSPPLRSWHFADPGLGYVGFIRTSLRRCPNGWVDRRCGFARNALNCRADHPVTTYQSKCSPQRDRDPENCRILVRSLEDGLSDVSAGKLGGKKYSNQ